MHSTSSSCSVLQPISDHISKLGPAALLAAFWFSGAFYLNVLLQPSPLVTPGVLQHVSALSHLCTGDRSYHAQCRLLSRHSYKVTHKYPCTFWGSVIMCKDIFTWWIEPWPSNWWMTAPAHKLQSHVTRLISLSSPQVATKMHIKGLHNNSNCTRWSTITLKVINLFKYDKITDLEKKS